MTAAAQELLSDSQIQSKKGIYEYLLGAKTDTKLLNVRVFTAAVKKRVYKKQTDKAKAEGVSNCSTAQLGMTRRRPRFGRCLRWMPTMSQRGRRVVPPKATASCCASPTTARRVTLRGVSGSITSKPA